jgi:hypothetical protein
VGYGSPVLYGEKLMLDFARARRNEISLAELVAGSTVADLHAMTDKVVDEIERIIAGAMDADVVFVPRDPDANHHAEDAANREEGWTLGHVIAHITAGGEEGGAHASSLARGVVTEGRSRYEVPWETITTIGQVRQRLAESRRMRHAFLNTWPDEPNLEITMTLVPRLGLMNAVTRYALGLMHDDWHLGQLHEIMRQAHAKRKK